jgi:transcriptional regulator with GAF, ATPase, and Fis domain
MNQPLITVDAALQALALASTPDELITLANQAAALQVYARRAKLGMVAQNRCAEIRLRAERKLGELLTTRFVGREHEVSLLLDRFERAAAGEGQAVLLSGEAGIGKSRIIRQLHERLSRIPHTRMRFQCSSSLMERALYPVSRHLEYAAGFQPGDELETRLDKLEALLRSSCAITGWSALS